MYREMGCHNCHKVIRAETALQYKYIKEKIMGSFDKKIIFGKNIRKKLMVTIAVIGAMSCMSGCSSSESPQTQEVPTESQTEVQIEAQIEAQTETQIETQTQSIQEEQSQPERTSEEAQTVGMETEVETEAGSQTEAETKAEEKPELIETVQAEAPAAEGSVAAGDFAVVVKGVTIPLGSDLRDYTALLGEPDEYSAAKSCVEAGEDKVYTYGGAVIYTYITNGADIVTLIEITGSEALPSGIHIGSTRADVIAAYGSAYTEEGTELLYELGDKTIGLQLNGETVSFMELFGR